MPTKVFTAALKSPTVRARLVLVSIFALFFLPVFGAMFIAVVAPHWMPFGSINHGELVQPPIAGVLLNVSPLDDGSVHTIGPKAPWVIAHLGPPRCDANCEYALGRMRQARLALGKDAHRVERWWVVTGPLQPGDVKVMMRSYPGLRIGQLPSSSPLVVPAPSSIAVQMIDPAGFLILRYSTDWQQKEQVSQGATGLARAILKDFKRLLKISKQP
jgi:hypothetical protein